MDEDFDLAVSRRMQVDHGFAQPLQLLWGGLDTPPVVPIFMNAVAQPGIPRLRRCRALGQAIGRWLDGEPRRTLLIGSGGLSHEPPVPTLVASRCRGARAHHREERTDAGRARREDAARDGRRPSTGRRHQPAIKPLNPQWDRRWMDALAQGGAALDALVAMSEDSIERDAGLSGHESKSWLVARSALPTDRALPRTLSHYQAIPEYIAGFGLMVLKQPN